MRHGKYTIILLLPVLMTAFGNGCVRDPEKDALKAEIGALKKVVERLEGGNRLMWGDIRERSGAEQYIVVDTGANLLHLRRGEEVLLRTAVSTGSGKKLEEQGGRKWIFNTPKGAFTVLTKEEDPLWYKPDWAFVEDGLPVPPPDSPDRIVAGMLGKYALGIGGGYKIHGTPHTKLLGQAVSHGCVRVGNEDMERLYRQVPVGAKVFIY